MPIFGKKIEDMSDEELLEKGMDAFSNEKWGKAREYLTPFVERVPDHEKGRVTLAQALFHLEKQMDSIIHYAYLARNHPDNAEYAGIHGIGLSVKGRKEEAIRELERSLQIQENQTFRGYLIHLTYEKIQFLNIEGQRGNFTEQMNPDLPEEIASKMVMTNFNVSDFLIAIAETCIEKRAFVSVESLCEEGQFSVDKLKEHLDTVEFSTGIRGRFAQLQGPLVIEFTKAHDGLYTFLAKAEEALKQREFEEAERSAREFISYSSHITCRLHKADVGRGWRLLGDSLLERRPPMYEEAEEAYKKADSIYPNDPETLHRFILLYRIMKRYDEGRKLLQELPKEALNSPGVLIAKAILLAEMGEHDEAEQLARLLTETLSEHSIVWCAFAHVLQEGEKWEEAVQASKKAIELDASDISGWLNLSESYIGHKDFNQAEQAIEKALQLEEELGDAWYLKSKILDATGRPDEAREAMDKAGKFGHGY